jgi:hypothetical protein
MGMMHLHDQATSIAETSSRASVNLHIALVAQTTCMDVMVVDEQPDVWLHVNRLHVNDLGPFQH